MVGLLFSLFKRPLEELEIDDRTLDAIGRVLDISFANRRLREGVVASERRYRDLFEASPDALLVEDQEKVVDANDAEVLLLELRGQFVGCIERMPGIGEVHRHGRANGKSLRLRQVGADDGFICAGRESPSLQ